MRAVRAGVGGKGLERVVLVIVVAGKAREDGRPHRAHLAAPVEVADRVLQDALEQHRELVDRVVAVFFRQLEHAVLHDVEGTLFVAHGEHGLLERPALNGLQEVGQFLG